jgi:hypothetical protein
VTVVVLLLVGSAHGAARDYASIKAEAERLYAEQSYARAHALYSKAQAPTPEEERWVAFRLADTRWRMDPVAHSDAARGELSELLESAPRPLWMEIQESLGDSWWTSQAARDWHRAWPHYAEALRGWAESRELERARKRYLGLVDRIAQVEAFRPEPYRTHDGTLPLEVLENALSLARTPLERAHLQYLLATALQSQGDWSAQQRIPGAFETALQAGRKTAWYDDALYQYAEWLARRGRPVIDEHGNERFVPDLRAALPLYRRLVTEFAEGETRYRSQAARMIEEITSPELQVLVSNAFLPGSEVEFELIARNLEQVDLALHAVALDRALDLQEAGEWRDWIDAVELGDSRPVRTWSRQLDTERDHAQRREDIRLEDPLESGAYLVLARSGKMKARALLLISDAALIVKASGEKLAAFFCDAVSGAPLPGAEIVFWTWRDVDEKRSVERLDAATNADGLAVLERKDLDEHASALVVARSGARQALAQLYAPGRHARRGEWRIYAFTDRPAYRPSETVQWKALARISADGRYTTPAGVQLGYRIENPRGTAVKTGRLTLNDFGSGFSELALDEHMVLGPYRLVVSDEEDARVLGSATLFRLEE